MTGHRVDRPSPRPTHGMTRAAPRSTQHSTDHVARPASSAARPRNSVEPATVTPDGAKAPRAPQPGRTARHSPRTAPGCYSARTPMSHPRPHLRPRLPRFNPPTTAPTPGPLTPSFPAPLHTITSATAPTPSSPVPHPLHGTSPANAPHPVGPSPLPTSPPSNSPWRAPTTTTRTTNASTTNNPNNALGHTTSVPLTTFSFAHLTTPRPQSSIDTSAPSGCGRAAPAVVGVK
jgi:hypothetical protein